MKQSSDYTRITTTETTTIKMETRVRTCASAHSLQTINIFSSHMISGRKTTEKDRDRQTDRKGEREREKASTAFENVLCVRRADDSMHIANMSCL